MKKSNCCEVNIIDETEVCSKCKEHCDAIDDDLQWLEEDWVPTSVKYNGKELK